MDQGSQLYMTVGGSEWDIIGNNSARGDNGVLTSLSSDGGVHQYNHIGWSTVDKHEMVLCGECQGSIFRIDHCR
jgi:hypothetical protein